MHSTDLEHKAAQMTSDGVVVNFNSVSSKLQCVEDSSNFPWIICPNNNIASIKQVNKITRSSDMLSNVGDSIPIVANIYVHL